jgi:hypothetical protein
LASDKKINTIDVLKVSPFLVSHTKAAIDSVNSYGPKWEDINLPIRFPFVTRESVTGGVVNFFGAPVNQLDYYFIVESDLTPYVSLLAVLQRGYLEIGWKFECPFLESDYGRRIWVDLCKDDFPQTIPRVPLLLENCFGFYACVGYLRKYRMFRNVITNGPFYWEESTTPPITNQWFNDGYFSEAIIADFNISMRLKRVSPTTKVFTGDVHIIVTQNYGPNSIAFKEIIRMQYFISGGDEVAVDFDISEIYVNERHKLSVEIELRQQVNSNDPFYIQVTDIRIAETKLHRRFLNKTSLYNVQDLFYEDSLLDLTKGAAQMIYGKIDVNTSNRVVKLLSPYETEIDGIRFRNDIFR